MSITPSPPPHPKKKIINTLNSRRYIKAIKSKTRNISSTGNFTHIRVPRFRNHMENKLYLVESEQLRTRQGLPGRSVSRC